MFMLESLKSTLASAVHTRINESIQNGLPMLESKPLSILAVYVVIHITYINTHTYIYVHIYIIYVKEILFLLLSCKNVDNYKNCPLNKADICSYHDDVTTVIYCLSGISSDQHKI